MKKEREREKYNERKIERQKKKEGKRKERERGQLRLIERERKIVTYVHNIVVAHLVDVPGLLLRLVEIAETVWSRKIRRRAEFRRS